VHHAAGRLFEANSHRDPVIPRDRLGVAVDELLLRFPRTLSEF
jgi:hypothetical protein